MKRFLTADYADGEDWRDTLGAGYAGVFYHNGSVADMDELAAFGTLRQMVGMEVDQEGWNEEFFTTDYTDEEDGKRVTESFGRQNL